MKKINSAASIILDIAVIASAFVSGYYFGRSKCMKDILLKLSENSSMDDGETYTEVDSEGMKTEE